jgi:hypothetical protein
LNQKTGKIVASLLCLCAAVSQAQQPGPREWTLRYCLVNARSAITLAHLYVGAPPDAAPYTPRTGDLMAEYLVQFAADPRLNAHYSAELIAALPESAGGRYRTAMRRLRESKAPVGVKIAALGYLQKAREGDPMYVPGSIDMAGLRDAYATAALAVTPTQARAKRLGELAAGDSLDRLFEVMGPPQAVRVHDFSRIRRLIFYYRGAGRVVYGALGDLDWRLQAFTADPILFESEMPYRTDAAKYGQPDDLTLRMTQLATGRLLPGKVAVEAAYHAPTVSLEFLDTAAEYLSRSWPDTSVESQDALAWFVRLLQKRGGQRYAPLLKDIAARTTNLKLRHWARQTVHRVAGVPQEPFVPGTVPLAAVASKYPTLYPDVTFTAGVL